MSTSSIRKLVMINTGVYGYAEIDLQGSAHLAGDNNRGKTSLINVFQFFYVDDWNIMRFPNSNEETRRYYFNENSYILLEVETPSGIKLVGLRGLGPQKSYDYERFVVSGPYERDGFMDGERLRAWEDISQNHLAPRVVKPQTKLVLDRKELRNAFTGSGDSAGVRLELAPPANNDAFVRIFLNLLSLKRTKEADLKGMILDSLGAEIEKRTLNLAMEFSPLSKGIQNHAHQLKLIEGAESEGRKLERDHRALKSLVAGLPTDWVRLNEGLYQGIVSLRGQAEALEGTCETAGERLNVISRERREVADAIEKMKRQRTEAETNLVTLDRHADTFFGFDERAIHDRPRTLESLLEPLRGQLAVQTGAGSRKEIEGRLRELEAKRAQKEAFLANPKASWSARLLGECDDSQRASVLRLIHPDLLTLPEGSDGVVIKDEGRIFRTIAELDARVKDGVYEDAGIRLNLRSIPVPKEGVFDPVMVERDIEGIRAEEAKLHAVLKEVASLEALKREVQALDAQWKEAIAHEALYKEWRTREESRPEYDRKLREAEESLASLGNQKETLDSEIRELEDRIRESRDMARGRHKSADAMKAELAAFQALQDPNWDLPDPETVGDIPGPEDIGPLVEDYRTRFQKANNHFDMVTRGLALLQTNLGSLLPGADMDEIMRNLADQLDSLPERKKNRMDEKTALVGQASRSFADFYRGFENVKSWVGTLNKGLTEVQVSDLRSVEIRLVPTSQAGIIADLADAQTSPLFAADRLDEAVKRIVDRMEDKQTFALEEMFGLHIKVVKANGETKLYDKLDTESTGTAMTFKVVLIARMLREVAKMRGTRSIRLPLFVDEADTLDDLNRTTILNLAEKLGFGVIMASPNALPAHRVYLLHATNGRTWITLEDEHLLLEREADEVSPADAMAPDELEAADATPNP
jgi:predicted  nucleic acid-binding Zn-ribbon protein